MTANTIVSVNRKPFKEPIRWFASSVPVNAGWMRKQLFDSYPLAYHHEYEFHLIKRGHGAYHIGGKTCRFGPRHLMIIRPNQIHGFVAGPGRTVEKAHVLFRGEWLGDFLRALNIDKTFPSLICLPDLPAVRIEMILNRILEENSLRDKGWEEMIREMLREFLLWVIRFKDHPVYPREGKPLFVQIRQYLESHFDDPQCNVTRIADKFGYSLNYLSALFKEASGIGIKQYLLQSRIIAARQILDDNAEMKIEAIARQVGFNQYRNFVRAFFNLTGISPSGYRKNCHIHRKN